MSLCGAVTNAEPICQTYACLAYYAFEGNADDASGHDRHATASSGVSWVTGCHQGQALYLAGVASSYVDISSEAWLADITQWTAMAFVKCTVCYWVYGENAASGSPHKNALGVDLNKPFANYPPGHGPAPAPTGLADDALDDVDTTWRHVAWVRESGTIYFYVDGVQACSEASESYTGGTPTINLMGWRKYGNGGRRPV